MDIDTMLVWIVGICAVYGIAVTWINRNKP